MAEPTVDLFIPIVLTEAEAEATYHAVRTVFMSGVGADADAERLRPLAQSMVKVARAIDTRREEASADA